MILSDKQLAALNKHFDSLNEEFGKELDLKTLAEQNLIKVETKEMEEMMECLSRLESKIDELLRLEMEEDEGEEEEKSLSIKEVIAAKNLKVTLSEDNSQIKSTVSMKMARKSKREDYYPTDEELALINQSITKVDVAKEEGYVFQLIAADDQIDRGLERFSKNALLKMADLAVKNQIPVLLATNGTWGDHEWLAKNCKGVVFDAFIDKGKLIYKAYFPNTDSNKEVVQDILAGLLSKLSVGFAMDLIDYECSVCKGPIISAKCPHQLGAKTENGDYVFALIKNVMDNFEVSLVAVPMQSQTNIRRNSLTQENIEIDLAKEFPAKEDGTPIYARDNQAILNTVAFYGNKKDHFGDFVVGMGETVELSVPSDKILNDTIQDNRMEDNKELAEKEAEKEAVVVETKADSVVASPANDELNSLKEKVEALTAELKSLTEKTELIPVAVDNTNQLNGLEAKVDALSKSVTESLASLAKALEVINENLAKVDDKVEKSATSPAVLKTQSYKEETEQHPIVGLLSNLRKQ